MGAVQRLHIIWQSKDIHKDTKLQLYKTLILSILLHGAEIWTLKKADENRLQVFEMAWLHKILKSRLEYALLKIEYGNY